MTAAIDTAIEQVVRDSSDPDALLAAVRGLADLLGHQLTPKPLPALCVGDQVRLTRDLPQIKAGTEGQVIDVLSDITVDVLFDGRPYPMLTRREDVEPIDGRDDTAGYETDAEPKPQHGDHGTCAICGTRIHYSANWHDDGGWWTHAAKWPADGHHAVFGGPA